MADSDRNKFLKALQYWSIENLDALFKDFGGQATYTEKELDEIAGRSKNYPQARAYLRFLHGVSKEYGLHDVHDCTGSTDSSDLCPACSRRADRASSDDINYFQVGPDDSLLVGNADGDDHPRCSNLHSQDGHLWVKEPDFYPKLSAAGMGFLSQVAHVCLYAKVYVCENKKCKNIKEEMAERAPHVPGWKLLKEWAITAMSCQENHRRAWKNEQSAHYGHTHIAAAVAGLAMVLNQCSRACYKLTHVNNYLDGFEEKMADDDVLNQVLDLLYWMVSIQFNYSVGPDQLGRWGADVISTSVVNRLGRHKRAFDLLSTTKFCKYRVWTFLEVCDRKDADLPTIVFFLHRMEGLGGTHGERNHEYCTPKFCQQANVNSTKVEQLNLCNNPCENLEFSMSQLEDAINDGRSTAWLCGSEHRPENQVQLAGADDKDYVAISHVWSDGTGVGAGRGHKDSHMVRSCLWKFWEQMVDRVWRHKGLEGRQAVWWDTVCIPSDQGLRVKALKNLHKNYSGAKCTIIHDKELAHMEWSDDGKPCIALVLSNWFSRGWTALELQMSREVKVLFKNGAGHIVPYDLDKEIMASSPSTASPVHWMASNWIKRLRKPINDVGDIIHTLNARSTSWKGDKTTIAALLADVPQHDFKEQEHKEISDQETEVTKEILKYLGKVPALSLLHGEATMTNEGPWSWCPSSLFDMPAAPPVDVDSWKMSDLLSLLDISTEGSLSGAWNWRKLEEKDAQALPFYGRDTSSRMKVRIALQDWDNCLLLRPLASLSREEPALLVKKFDEEEDAKGRTSQLCHYVGAVWEIQPDDKKEWKMSNIILGRKKNEGNTQNAHRDVVDEMELADESDADGAESDFDDDADDDDEEGEDGDGNDDEGEEQSTDGILPKPEPMAWLDDARSYEEWEGFSANFQQHIRQTTTSSLKRQLLRSVVCGNQEAAQYLFQRLAEENENLDPGLNRKVKSRVVDSPDANAHDYANAINGLWALGDCRLQAWKGYRDLQNEELEKAERVYSAAIDLYNSLSEKFPDSSLDVPVYAKAMLTYQRGLTFLLRGKLGQARSCFINAIKWKKETSGWHEPVIDWKRDPKQRGESTKFEDEDGWYFVERGALGALILLSLEKGDNEQEEDENGLTLAARCFENSLRHEERKDLRDFGGWALVNYSLRLPVGDHDVTADAPEIESLRKVTLVLQRVLQKFDVLFRQKHMLCCVAALCVGVALQMEGNKEDADMHFRRVKDDLGELLPNIAREDPEEGVEQWNLYRMAKFRLGETFDEDKTEEDAGEDEDEDGAGDEGDAGGDGEDE